MRSGLRPEIINNKSDPVELNGESIENIFRNIENIYNIESKQGEDLKTRADLIREARNNYEGSNGFIIQHPIDSISKNRPEQILDMETYRQADSYVELSDELEHIDWNKGNFENILAGIVKTIKEQSGSELALIAGVIPNTGENISAEGSTRFCVSDVDGASGKQKNHLENAFLNTELRYLVKGYQPMLPGTGVNLQERSQHIGFPLNFMMRSPGLDQANKRLTVFADLAIDLRVGRSSGEYSIMDLARLMKTARDVQFIFDSYLAHRRDSEVMASLSEV